MSTGEAIYLDCNATTPVDERVLDAMLPYFTKQFGNAASKTHAYGWVAYDAVELARKQVAALINAEPSEIIFTSGATEGINLAIKGVWNRYRTKGKHIVVASTEHKAALDCCEVLEKQGAEVTRLPVDHFGFIDLKKLEESIRNDTVLVAVMLANNETGLIQPVKEISEIVHQNGSIFLSDTTQGIGKMKLDVQELGIDLAPISAHKFYGPKGVGALYVRRKSPRVSLQSQIDGGGHERGLRSGTLNVPGIVGLGKACEVAKVDLKDDQKKMISNRDLLWNELFRIDGVRLNGSPDSRLINTLNVSFEGVIADRLLKLLATKVALATGSACTSAIKEPSHVLKSMGLADDLAYGSVRFSLGRFTTEKDVRTAAIEVIKAVEQIRSH